MCKVGAIAKARGSLYTRIWDIEQNGRGANPKEYRKDNYESRSKREKEYREVNREARLARAREYREAHREAISDSAKKPYTCVCGSVCRTDRKSKHERTKTHQTFIANSDTSSPLDRVHRSLIRQFQHLSPHSQCWKGTNLVKLSPNFLVISSTL